MKKNIQFVWLTLFVLISNTVAAQIGDVPSWVTTIPTPQTKGNFYYRVTMGEGQTYDKAYANAFAKALLEAAWKHGVRVNTQNDMAALENSITESINVENHTMELPMNKVCDYWEQLYSPNRIRLYVLWQIADDALKDPKFEVYTKCQ